MSETESEGMFGQLGDMLDAGGSEFDGGSGGPDFDGGSVDETSPDFGGSDQPDLGGGLLDEGGLDLGGLLGEDGPESDGGGGPEFGGGDFGGSDSGNLGEEPSYGNLGEEPAYDSGMYDQNPEAIDQML